MPTDDRVEHPEDRDEGQDNVNQCAAVDCERSVDMWVEFGVAPVSVGFCEHCGEEVV